MPLGTEQNKVLEHCLQAPMGHQGPQLMVGLPSGTVQMECPSDDGKVSACSSLSSLLGLKDQALLWKSDPPSSLSPGTRPGLTGSIPKGEPQVPRPKFLITTPLPDLNALELSLHLAEALHGPGWDGRGWVPISALGLRIVEGLVYVPSDCLLALWQELLRLQHSQLPTAAMLPVAGGLSLQHKLESPHLCSTLGTVK